MTQNKSENGNVITLTEIKNMDEKSKAADFETAITATGFGKFNILLILIAMPSVWSSIFETTTMSYVFPAAQCDLNLTLADKGLLNAITYVGMISSAFLWGFLCDTLGRRKLLCIGLFLDAVFVIMSASSQNVTLLMVAKFLGGFIVNGPFAAITTYVSEFHCAKYRTRVQMTLGIMMSFGTVVLPLLAWAVLPINFDVKAFNDSAEFHSWNLFLLICSIPPLVSATAFIFMPESPKFLMTCGRRTEALRVFKSVYSLNTGKPAETFPITELLEEKQTSKYGGQVTANRNTSQALKEGWQQIKPIFFPPHLLKILLVCFMQMMIMMSLNTLRLWLPQIFQAITDYKLYHNGTTASLCTMIKSIRTSGSQDVIFEECVVNTNDNSFVYINSMIVALVTIGGYIVAGMLINALGKKRVLCALSSISGLAAMSIYFAYDGITTTVLSAIFVCLGSVSINVVLAIVVDLFPTTLRTMCVSLTMMVGRAGPLLGNLLFPFLLSLGCAPPFFSVGAAILSCGLLACLLPNTDMKALE